MKSGAHSSQCTPWTQDVNWTQIRHLEDILDVFWTSYVRSVYALCPGGSTCHDRVAFAKIKLKVKYPPPYEKSSN